MIEPLRMSFDIERAVEQVFRIWTANFAQWWPPSHTVSGADDVRVVFEARLGGRIFEQTPAGATHEWGEITLWEPPRRLGYLWYLRRDRADATEVDVRFVARGNATRVEIEHRGWERLGAQGPGWREANKGGWSGLLPHFMAACEVTPGRKDTTMTTGSGTQDDPWRLKTPPGTSEYQMWKDEAADPPAIVCQVGRIQLRYRIQAIDDLHAMLKADGGWLPLGGTDEQKPAPEGTVEAWGRSADNPVGGWYGLKKGLRGRFGTYLPPLLEALGLAEVTHDARNNRMRAL